MPARFDSGPHDDGLGVTHDLEMATATALRVDAGAWFAAAWPSTLRVPTFTEVLDELGGRTVPCPEAKNAGAGQAMVDQLFRLGLVDTAIVQSFMRAELTGPNHRRRDRHGVDRDVVVRRRGIACCRDPLSGAVCRPATQPCCRPPQLAWTWSCGSSSVGWTRRLRAPRAPSVFPTPRSTCPADLRYWYPTRTDGARTTTGTLASAVAGDRGQFVSPHGWGYMDTSPEYKALCGAGCPISSAQGWLDPHAHHQHRGGDNPRELDWCLRLRGR